MTEPEQQQGTPPRRADDMKSYPITRQQTADRDNRTPGRRRKLPTNSNNTSRSNDVPTPNPLPPIDTGEHDGDGNDDDGDIASPTTTMSHSLIKGRNNDVSFDDQSVETLQTKLDEMNNQDHHPFGTVRDARPILPKIAFCMGDIRDGLAMVSALLD